MGQISKRLKENLFDFLFPSERNGFIPRALSARSFFYYGFLILLVSIIMFSPLTKTLPWRVFLANLSQELILAKTNPARQSAGLSPLRIDPLLSEGARMKAEDMIAKDYFSHIGPNGELPWRWIEALGYKYSAAGENLAVDFSDPGALVNAWLASPTHATNIKNGIFTDVGIGIAEGSFTGRKTAVVVMFLGRKAKVKNSVVSVKVNPVSSIIMTRAVNPSTPKLSEKVLAFETKIGKDSVEVQKPLIVRVEPIEREDIISENTNTTQEILAIDTPIVSSEKIKVVAFNALLVRTPVLARNSLSIFFAGMFLFAVVFFALNKSWAPLMLSRASISLLIISVLWIPEFF